jgi:phosphatidylserine decarboxylase
MSIHEKLYFVRQVRDAFETIGAVIPTSHYAARAMAAECARHHGPKKVLEVGAGTGSITAEIVKHIGPQDQLVVCEINPEFVAYLHQRFAQEPAFQHVRDRVQIVAGSVMELETQEPFDYIISAIPFTNCPPEFTETIFQHYQQLLKPGGVLTYIEYAFLRNTKRLLATGDRQSTVHTMNQVLNQFIEQYQFRQDLVWRNVPPAWIRHLRFQEARIHQATELVPLEHTHRIELGPLTIADDALPFAGGLLLLATVLRSAPRKLWTIPAMGAALATWFLRDPRRKIKQNHQVVYASCDGRVQSIEHVHDTRLGNQEWVRIATFLSLAHVHINRMPVAGKVVQLFRDLGGYAPAYSARAESNAACYTVIEGVHGRCIVVQRVGLIARRIVNWSGVGMLVAQGERFGLLRFGSRTDVYLPSADVEVCVAPGDTIQAGITVIARYTDDTAR